MTGPHAMAAGGWQQLFQDWSWVRGEGRFPIPAYSEFMPPPRIGQKPYGHWEVDVPFVRDDPWGWAVSATERERELDPGMAGIAKQLSEAVVALATGRRAHKIGRYHLEDNPYWPKSLAERSTSLEHERYLFLSPLALSKTQDDKGRVRWTLFGASHLGPARGFWNSFFAAPGVERPERDSLGAMRQLLQRVYGEAGAGDLRATGFRVMSTGALPEFPELEDGPLPAWARSFVMGEGDPIEQVRYLLTFRPFELLPEPVQRAYFAGRLHLLPSPVTMVFWGSSLYRKLDAQLPFARQILLLQSVARHASQKGIRVPQSGWLHPEGHAHDSGLGEAKNGYRRTHRWQRVHKEDDATEFAREDHLHKVLFSSHPDDVGLYGKPMARNAQIWSNDFKAVLDGPNADGAAIAAAEAQMANGHSFGYRFFYPPMQTGRHAVFWHRPLIAFRDPASGKVETVDVNLNGYLTAGDPVGVTPEEIALWPRMSVTESRNVPSASRNLLSAAMVKASEIETGAPRRTTNGNRAATAFSNYLGLPFDRTFDPREALTFGATAKRAFEVRYWKTIAKLAEGRYLNKNSADCSQDAATQSRIPWPERDLDQLGTFLLGYYRRLARASKTPALVGEMPFRWQTDFDFHWMGGWEDNQTGHALARNIAVIIPGRNRNEAIVMGDHYDTAYMEDVYGYRSGKNDGARMAASGADDNHSATTALMLGAEMFMRLSREGKLERDIWLVHLTGEEFPSDCLGARHLSQMLVEGRCRVKTSADQFADLSGVAVQGVYVLDMIAHNNDKRKDVFQIAPGADKQSLWLAYQAHAAASLWQAGAAKWNASGKRKNLGRGRRSPHGAAIPLMARHLAPKGEVRFHDEPRSTLFNTDGQIFSDAGIPTVLFMENYDINREGYHDTQDTMANIDLDYGAAVAAIAIESVARAASEKLP